MSIESAKQEVEARYVALPRVWNWHDRFYPFITKIRQQAISQQLSFNWGIQEQASTSAYDCMSFCGQVVESLTGKDVYKEWLAGATYDSPIGAYKVMRSRGYNNVDQLLRSLFKEIRYETAHVGDLVVVKTNLILTLN